MWLPNLWRMLFPVREVLVAVPVGFEKAADGKPDADPRFLREMAESMKACPVVYENMNVMLKRRLALLQVPPPTTTQAERDTDSWQKEKASTEAALLRFLLLGPVTCTQALNEIASRKKAVESTDHENWSLEGVQS